jgi:hypothetical protein
MRVEHGANTFRGGDGLLNAGVDRLRLLSGRQIMNAAARNDAN